MIHGAALTLISTFLVFKLNLIWSCRCSTMGVNIFIQFSFSGVYLLAGTGTFLTSPFPTCGQRGGEQRTRADPPPGPSQPLPPGPALTPRAAAGSGGKAGLLLGCGPAASADSAASIGSAPAALRFLRPRFDATLVKPLSSAASVSMATAAAPKLAPLHSPRGPAWPSTGRAHGYFRPALPPASCGGRGASGARYVGGGAGAAAGGGARAAVAELHRLRL